MAALTWRNVDAPDFRSAMSGYRDSTAMLDNALSRISEGLSNFRAEQQRGADQQVILNSLKYTDPKAYNEALASGAITAGIDPNNVSARTLSGLGSRSADLLQQAALGQRMEANQYALDRTRSNNTIEDNARASTAREYGITDPALAALSPQDQATLVSNKLNQAGKRIANATGQFNLDASQRDDRDRQEAYGIIGDINRQAIDEQSAREQGDTASSPGARFLVDQALSRLYPNAYGPNSLTAGPGGGDTFSNMISQESGGRQFGSDGKPLTSSKGATGRAQVMPGTGPEAAKLAGLPWDENRFKNDAEYNTALGKAYFDKQVQDFGGDEAKAAAAYNAGPTRVKEAIATAAKSGNPDGWLALLPRETQDYVPAVTGGAVRAAQADLGVRQMQNVGQQGATTDLFQNLTNTDTVGKVADTLLSSDFKGANRDDLIYQLNDIVQRGATNPAQAGAILRRNISAASTWNPFSRNFAGTTNLGGGIGFNDQRLNADLEAQRTGVNIDQALTNQDAALVSQQITQAQQNAQNASAALARVVAASQSRPELARNIPRYQAAADRASQTLQAMLDNQRTTPAFRAQRPMSQRTQETVPPEQVNRNLNQPAPAPQTYSRQDLEFGLYD